MTDDEAKSLIRELKQGNAKALRPLFDAYKSIVCWMVRKHCAGTGDIEEVMNDVLMAVWRSAGKFEARSSVRTWIIGIAKNKALEKARSTSLTNDVVVNPGTSDNEDEIESAKPEQVSPAPGPDEMLAAARTGERVKYCKSKLSEAHADAIELIGLYGCTHAEAAEAMNCPIGASKSRYFYAKALLKKCLERNFGMKSSLT